MTSREEVSAYPEQVPEAASEPLRTFTFNIDKLPHTLREIETMLEEKESQLESYEVNTSVHGYNLIQALLRVTHDRGEIKRFAIALFKAADLIGPIDELTQLRDFIIQVQQRPAMAAWAFGDFEDWPDELDMSEFV